MVVGGFAGDDDVMDVRLAEAGVGDADEAGVGLELGDGGAAEVAHTGAQAADELVDHGFKRAAVRDAAFDALGDEFGEAVLGGTFAGSEVGALGFAGFEVVLALEVALAGALGHGGERAHAAVGLEGAALVEDGFAGAFVDAGEEGAHHADAGTGGDRLGDVSGVLDASVGDDGDSLFRGSAGGFADGGDLGHAGSGDHASGADGARADADLDGVGSGVDEGEGAVVGGDVAGEEGDGGVGFFDGADGLENARGVAVGRVDGEGVDAHVDEAGGALEEVAGGPDGSGDAETALLVFGGVGVFEFFLDVLDGDEAFELEVVIDDEEFFDAVLVQDVLGLFKGGADGHGDEVFLGHDGVDGEVGAGDEAEVAVGENADQLAVLGDGDAGDLVAAHDLKGGGDGFFGGDGDGVDDHAGFGALDLVDLAGLLLDGEIAVDDAHAALLGHGDGEARLGDGVHGGGHERGVEGDGAGEACLRADLGGDDVRVGGDQEDIVEGQGFGDF